MEAVVSGGPLTGPNGVIETPQKRLCSEGHDSLERRDNPIRSGGIFGVLLFFSCAVNGVLLGVLVALEGSTSGAGGGVISTIAFGALAASLTGSGFGSRLSRWAIFAANCRS